MIKILNGMFAALLVCQSSYASFEEIDNLTPTSSVFSHWQALDEQSKALPLHVPERELKQSEYEYIDLPSATLILRHLEVRLPSNGGLDIAVYRIFDPTIKDNAFQPGNHWYIGHSFVRETYHQDGKRKGYLVYLPDGGVQELFPGEEAGRFFSQDHWRGQYVTRKGECQFALRSPKGLSYVFSFTSCKDEAAKLSRVLDLRGNWVAYHYAKSGELTEIVNHSGDQVLFDADDQGIVSARTSDGREWHYTWQERENGYPGGVTEVVLGKVQNPDGSAWKYEYTQPSKMVPPAVTSIITPTNSEIHYQTIDQAQVSGSDEKASTVLGRVISAREILHPDGSQHHWHYQYHAGRASEPPTFSVTTADGRTVYQFYPYGIDGQVWRYGLLDEKHIYDKNDKLLQKEKYTWGQYLLSKQPYQKTYYTRANRQDKKSKKEASYVHEDTSTYGALLTSLTIVRDGSQYSTAYENYDAYGNPQKIIESGQNKRTWKIHYVTDDTQWLVSGFWQSVDLDGVNIKERTYNHYGNVIDQTLLGIPMHYTYTAQGDMANVKDELGNRVDYTDYQHGIPQGEQHPEGVVIKRKIDSAGRIVSQTDGNQHTRQYQYDPLGRLASVQLPKGDAYRIVWFDRDNPDQQVLSRGHYQERVWINGLGKPVRIEQQDTVGKKTRVLTRQYNHLGLLTFESFPMWRDDEHGQGTTTEYDALGRVTQQTSLVDDGQSKITTFDYQPNHQQVVSTHQGGKTTLSYSAFGHPEKERYLIGIQRGAAKPMTIKRNHLGLVEEMTQGAYQARYAYNQHYQLVSSYQPAVGQLNFGYDLAGNLIWQQINRGQKLFFEYDGLHRLVAKRYGKRSPIMQLDYDKNHNIVKAKNDNNDWFYQYDANNHLAKESLHIDRFVFSVAYDRNALGHVTRMHYPGKNVVTFSPDAFGLPSQLGQHFSEISYHPSGIVSQARHPRRLDFHQAIYPSQRLQQVTFNDVELSYHYDASGKLLALIDDTNSRMNINHEYDQDNRLVASQGPWGHAVYHYDDLGNVVEQSLGVVKRHYHYDQANRLVQLKSPIEQEVRQPRYDKNGNVTTNGNRHYPLQFDFDLDNRLTKVSGAENVRYRYDAFGRPVGKEGKQGNQVYFYNHANQLLFVKNVDTGEDLIYYHINQKPVVMSTAEKVNYLYRDGSGHFDMLVDEHGQEVSRNIIEPFGQQMLGEGEAMLGLTPEASGLFFAEGAFMDLMLMQHLSMYKSASFLPSTNARVWSTGEFMSFSG